MLFLLIYEFFCSLLYTPCQHKKIIIIGGVYIYPYILSLIAILIFIALLIAVYSFCK